MRADRWIWRSSRCAPAPRRACTLVPVPLLSRCAMGPECAQLSTLCSCQVQLCMPVFTGLRLIRVARCIGPRCKEQRGSKPFENPHDQPLCRGGCATSGEPFYSITAPPATIRIASGSSKHPLLPPQVAFMPSTRSTVVLLTPPHHRSLVHGALARLRVCVRVGCFKVSFLSSWTKTDLSC